MYGAIVLSLQLGEGVPRHGLWSLVRSPLRPSDVISKESSVFQGFVDGREERERVVRKWTRSLEKSTSKVQSKATSTFFSKRGSFIAKPLISDRL